MNKKLFKANIILCFFFAALQSCNQDEVETNSSLNNEGKFVINVLSSVTPLESNNTRVALLDDDKCTQVWSSGDKIALRVDNNTETNTLNLVSGDGTASASFSGTITQTTGDSLFFAYPETAFDGIDFTSQTGTKEDAAKNIVMYARSKFISNPTPQFNNKSSILKIYLDAPTGVTDPSQIKGLYVCGAYAKSILNIHTGQLTNTSATINVSNATIVNDKGTYKVVAYVSVLPFSLVKNLRIYMNINNDRGGNPSFDSYVTEPYTADSKVPQNKFIVLSNKKFVKSDAFYGKFEYYQWDAYNSYENTKGDWNEKTANCNPDRSVNAVASQSCKDCPSSDQIDKYIAAGIYKDSGIGDKTDEGYQSYIVNGVTYHNGLWIKKKDKITGSEESTVKVLDSNNKSIRTSGDYFFLPSCGYYDNITGLLTNPGTNANYWGSNKTYKFISYGSDKVAKGQSGTPNCGYLLWVAE